MIIPEGRQNVNSHVKAKVYERVKIAAIRRKVTMPVVLDEALKLWLEVQREVKK